MRAALAPVLLARPGWVPYGATLALDFTQGRGWRPNSTRAAASLLTITRASEGYAADAAGVWHRFASGQARITDLGLLVEEGRTNVVLHNRDLTNAAWTKSNVTAAKDQIGVDGVANSASSITATSSNGTCLQAVTLASSARSQTAFVKRLVGSGTVEMTMDNGSNWTAVTVTSDWTRVTIPGQTIANPTAGFRIATSGDSIAVDLVQNESGAFHTSPIETGGSSATRAVDQVTVNDFATWYNATAGTFFVEWSRPVAFDGNSYVFTAFEDNSNMIHVQEVDTDNGLYRRIITGGANHLLQGGAYTDGGGPYKVMLAYEANNSSSSFNGSSAVTDTSVTLPAPTALWLGARNVGVNSVNGFVRRLAYVPARLANAQLEAMTG
jgi:hypothetical protein